MITRVTLAVAVVLMVSSGALADDVLPGSIWQEQAFSVGNTTNPGISSLLNLVHGDSDADMFQYVGIDNEHFAPTNQWTGGFPGWGWCGDNCDTRGWQDQEAYLEQDVEAEGQCGIISVNSFLDAAGAQEQTVGASTMPKAQVQSLGVAADQVLMRSDGGGRGEADNYAWLDQAQEGANAAGSMSEASTVEAGQYGDVSGAPNSTVSLVGGLNATTAQGQVVY